MALYSTRKTYIQEKDRKQKNVYYNQWIYKTQLFGAKFMQNGSQIRKWSKIENLEMPSWEPVNQWGCDVTPSQ